MRWDYVGKLALICELTLKQSHTYVYMLQCLNNDVCMNYQ